MPTPVRLAQRLRFNKHGEPISAGTWDDIVRIINWVCTHWDTQDEGIWETRLGRRDHTYSRLMCWVAIERAIRIARQWGLPGDLGVSGESRDAIHRQIMQRG